MERSYGGTLVIAGSYYGVAGTTGNFVFAAHIAAVSSGDASRTAKAFGTVTYGTIALPGTVGVETAFTLTIGDVNSIAAFDHFSVAFGRNDTAAGTIALTALDAWFSLQA